MSTRTLASPGPFVVDDDDSAAEDKITINDNDIEGINELLENQPDLNAIFDGHLNIISDLEQSADNVDSKSSFSEVPSCSKCADEMPFKSGHDITLGTHIILGKYCPFEKMNEQIGHSVQSFADIFKFKQKFVYFHHAIVSEVVETSNFTAKVKLVEFTTVGSTTFKVVETEKVIDVREKNVFHKQYTHPRYTPEVIVARAKSRLNASNYDLFSNNCENVAVWCVSGEHESFQSSTFVDTKIRQIFSWLGSLLGKIKQYFLLDVVDDLPRFVKCFKLAIPFMVIAGVFFLIELIVSALRFIGLKNQHQRGLICSACYNERKNFLISKIICSVTATVVLAVIPSPSMIILAVSGIALGIASVLIVPHICSFLYRGIKSIVNPLYTIPKMVIRKAKHIRAGDVLTITGDHDILINKITLLEKVTSNTFVSLDIVHFQYRGLWEKRTVTRERFHFKLKEDLLQVIDIPEHEANPDEEVIQIAKEKASRGEQGFNTFWYRSSHVSRMCKVRNYSTTKKISSTERNVQTAVDVKAGDLVKFYYCKLPHEGIVVEKLSSGDLVEIEYYHVVNGTVKLETDRFNLGSGVIKKHVYSKEDCLDVKTTLERANTKLGENVHALRPYKSSRFIKSCKMAEKDGN